MSNESAVTDNNIHTCVLMIKQCLSFSSRVSMKWTSSLKFFSSDAFGLTSIKTNYTDLYSSWHRPIWFDCFLMRHLNDSGGISFDAEDDTRWGVDNLIICFTGSWTDTTAEPLQIYSLWMKSSVSTPECRFSYCTRRRAPPWPAWGTQGWGWAEPACRPAGPREWAAPACSWRRSVCGCGW